MVVSLILSLAIVFQVYGRLNPEVARTPQMGWNSWNCFAGDISEEKIKEIADVWIDLGLDKAGYQYLVIDDGFLHTTRDREGQLWVREDTFPNGMKAVGDYIHSKGLKFGIYSSAGHKTCMGQVASLFYQEVDALKYEEWGVDYLKYDSCYVSGLEAYPRFKAMSDALDQINRDVFYAICNWGEQSTTEWAYKLGHSWRTTGDIRPHWDSIMYNLRENERTFNPDGYGPLKGWNDPDMLEVGNEGLTYEQNQSHFILWAMVKSPLLLGNDIRKVQKQSKLHQLLTHSEIIAVSQDPLGQQARCVYNCDNYETGLQIWKSRMAGEQETYAIAIVNLSPKTVYAPIIKYKKIGLGWPVWHIADMLQRLNVGIRKHEYLMVEMKPHQTFLLKFTKANPGDCEIEDIKDYGQFKSESCPPKSCPPRTPFYLNYCS